MSKNRTSELEILFDSISESVDLSTQNEIFNACKLIIDTQKLSSSAKATLLALYEKGSLFDGDLPSKSGRDELETYGMSVRVIKSGEWGFNACTYRGGYAKAIISASRTQPINQD